MDVYTPRDGGLARSTADERESRSAGTDFCDANMDAIAEVFDECRIRYYFPWNELFAASSTDIFRPLRGVFAFHYALEHYPRTSVNHDAQFKDGEFEAV